MNICLISQDFRPMIGGIASHVDELSQALAGLGHKVDILQVTSGPENSYRTEGENPAVHRLVVKPALPFCNRLLYFYQGRRRLKNLMARNNHQVVHWHDLFAGAGLAKCAVGRAKIVWTNHTSEFLRYYQMPAMRRKMLREFSIAQKIIAPSTELADKATELFGRSAVFISNGVDVEKFKPGPDSPASSGPPTILCPRRIDPKNGIKYLVQAMPLVLDRFPDARLCIAGSVFDQKYLAEVQAVVKAQNTGRAVSFAGAVENERMPELYNSAAVVVLPSLLEATSIAGLEAMACGRPIVATNVGGLPEIMDNGREGILVGARDPEQLASAIIDLLSNESKAGSMGRNARERAERDFSWREIARKTVEVYRS